MLTIAGGVILGGIGLALFFAALPWLIASLAVTGIALRRLWRWAYVGTRPKPLIAIAAAGAGWLLLLFAEGWALQFNYESHSRIARVLSESLIVCFGIYSLALILFVFISLAARFINQLARPGIHGTNQNSAN